MRIWPALPILLLPAAVLADPPPVHRDDVIRRAEATFLAADANHDGWLTKAEYHAALAAIAKRYDAKTTAKGWAAVDAQFDAVDREHDGRISEQRFVNAALAHFDGADLNHDGTVTPNEARKAAKMKREKRK